MAEAIVQLKDKYGNDLHFGHLGDMLIPAFPGIPDFRQNKADIRAMHVKPDDVIITGFPKSGTHWNHQIAKMLLAGSAEYHSDIDSLRDFLEANQVKQGDNPPGSPPRVFRTHLKFHHLPQQILESKAKVIYLTRNPKDTWVSYYAFAHGRNDRVHYGGTWSQFFDLMISGFGYLYGDWFDHVRDWENVMHTQTQVPIFPSEFEDLKKDPVGQILKLDEFLGTHRGRPLCQQIADACSFPALKKVKDTEMREKTMKQLFKDGSSGYYRKGEVGDWKNWFT
ncbi:sulfotransferase 1C2-like, partial [Littorina saxatilis]|uniref:sulfotransferase 1C2-like n=1 Tax=Littorina saxatilis TaxID=31220 RepID=UPI0038B53A4D